MSVPREKLNCMFRLALFIGFFCIAGDSTAKVAATTLRELTSGADMIVVGRVADILKVKAVRLAAVEVIETLKGTPHKRIYYLAQPTWTCDITTGRIGETALFFFKEYIFDPEPSSMAFVEPERPGLYWVTSGPITFGGYKEPPGFRAEVVEVLGGFPLMTVYWSGRGRMPIREVQGIEYVTIWVCDVLLPAGVATIGGPEPEYADFIRSARLSEIVGLIKQQLGAKLPAIAETSSKSIVQSRSKN